MKKNIVIVLWVLSRPIFAFQTVDLNQASAEQIAELPGVGEKLARTLLNYRQKNGPWVQESDLLAVPGMKPAKLAALSGLITFGSDGRKKSAAKPPEPPPIPTTSLPRLPMIELAALEKIVLRTLGLNDDVEKSMQAQARRSALLPKLSLIFDFGRDVDLSEKKVTNNTDTLLRHGGHDIGLGLRAAFDLPELIFHKSELDVANLALKRLDKREKVLERLHQYYFRYVRLQESGQIPASLQAINNLALELKELAAAMDSLSKGAFTQFQGQGQ